MEICLVGINNHKIFILCLNVQMSLVAKCPSVHLIVINLGNMIIRLVQNIGYKTLVRNIIKAEII